MRLALNPFENKKPGKKADIEQKIEFELDEKVEKMMGQYRRMKREYTESFYKAQETLKNLDEILQPTQIDILLQGIVQEIKNHLMTAKFLSKIIQNSYDAGYNKFTLTTKNPEIYSIGEGLEGTEENPIQITIQGNIGAYFGAGSENCTYKIKGNTGRNCGDGSKNCTYDIQGNTGDMCGQESENCTYNIKGNAGNVCGNRSENCTYNIKGNPGDACGAISENCTFTTPNRKNYERMLKDVETYRYRGSKVELTEQ